MSDRLKIVIATPVLAPYSLGPGSCEDLGEFALALSRLGHQVSVIAPLHGDQRHRDDLFRKFTFHQLSDPISVQVGANLVRGTAYRLDREQGKLAHILIDAPDYFHRSGNDGDATGQYRDNCSRYVFFSRAVLELVRNLSLKPQILLCQGWQTALIPAFFKIECQGTSGFQATRTLMQIDNAAHQGQFWHWDMLLTGLDWKYFNWQQMEFFGNLNFLKAGLVFADALVTHSPTYARELLTDDSGCGLQGVFRNRVRSLTGILTGIDLHAWNPETDTQVNRNYTLRTATVGKLANKQALQRRWGLQLDPRQLLVGILGPFSYSHGIDLVPRGLENLIRRGIQAVFLGKGDALIEQSVQQFVDRHSPQAAVRLIEDSRTERMLLAGADLLLIPARSEPSARQAMIACRYGTLPLAHAVGGLADAVQDVHHAGEPDSTANGFLFSKLTPEALEMTLERARSLFHFPEQWQEIVRNAMRRDWSWDNTAQQYVQLFQDVLRGTEFPPHPPWGNSAAMELPAAGIGG